MRLGLNRNLIKRQREEWKKQRGNVKRFIDDPITENMTKEEGDEKDIKWLLGRTNLSNPIS